MYSTSVSKISLFYDIFEQENHDHQYGRSKRFHIQTTKKIGCEAKLTIKYVQRFKQYQVDSCTTSKEKKNKSSWIQYAVDQKLTCRHQTEFM